MLVMELSGTRNVGDAATLALATAVTTAVIFGPQLAQIVASAYRKLSPIGADLAYQLLGHEPEPAYSTPTHRPRSWQSKDEI
jgi:hypothetical protein